MNGRDFFTVISLFFSTYFEIYTIVRMCLNFELDRFDQFWIITFARFKEFLERNVNVMSILEFAAVDCPTLLKFHMNNSLFWIEHFPYVTAEHFTCRNWISKTVYSRYIQINFVFENGNKKPCTSCFKLKYSLWVQLVTKPVVRFKSLEFTMW